MQSVLERLQRGTSFQFLTATCLHCTKDNLVGSTKLNKRHTAKSSALSMPFECSIDRDPGEKPFVYFLFYFNIITMVYFCYLGIVFTVDYVITLNYSH